MKEQSCFTLSLTALNLQVSLLNAADELVTETDAGSSPAIASMTEKQRKEILALARRIDKLVEADCKANDVSFNAKTRRTAALARASGYFGSCFGHIS